MVSPRRYDVVVVGTGNAGLCAALAAAGRGSRVLMLERGPRAWRGGNSCFTDGAVRFAYRGLADVEAVVGKLPPDEANAIDVGTYDTNAYVADLLRLSGGRADATLANRLAEESFPTMSWLREQGVRFTLLYKQQAFRVGEQFRFWGGLVVQSHGAGREWVDALFTAAEANGVEIWYDARAMALHLGPDGTVESVVVERDERSFEVAAGAIVLASGGFEANAEWRVRHMGIKWERVPVRGTPFNTGDGIRMAMDVGAQPAGQWNGCHAVATDVNAPPHGDPSRGDVFKRHSYPFGLLVNRSGRRFVDEGADFRNHTYAKYGRAVLEQPGGVAYQLFDARVRSLLRQEYDAPEATRVEAQTLDELAQRLGIDRPGLTETVRAFNAAVQPGTFDPTIKDGKRTDGLEPPKSNWALPFDRPPFLAFPVTCGITFTFGGLKVDRDGRVLRAEGSPIVGLYAAGELIGGLFIDNYPGGAGLMAGAVFGRLAGSAAAQYAGS